MSLLPSLQPPQAAGGTSVARLTNFWHIACRSGQLRGKPLSRTILGLPLVLFRGADGVPGALLDRCPHRNVPLSLGKTVDGTLQCAYHGWRFRPEGPCTLVPGLLSEADLRSRRAQAFPTLEQDGFVWVHTNPDTQPRSTPFRFPLLDDPAHTTARGEITVQGSLHATLENILDVPHTSFLHAGLFRSSSRRNEITAVVRRGPDRVEAEFLGEPRPSGWIGRLLSPGGGIVTHFDRFQLPAVAQVEYRLGTENHLITTQSLTPISDFETCIHSVISFRLRIPGWLIKPFLRPIVWNILRQDARILNQQSTTIRRFGGEQYSSTEIDLLGPHILLLLRLAERGETPASEAIVEKRIRMTI